METSPMTTATAATLEALAARLGEMEAREAMHAREVAALRATIAEGSPLRAADAARPVAGRPRRVFTRRARAAVTHDAPTTAAARTSRRGMLGTAAKVAAAAVAAGVLVEQLETRPALADNLGNFSSSVSGSPAVGATGTNGAAGLDASSDTGYGVSATGGVGVYGLTSTVTSSAGVWGSFFGSGSGIGVRGDTQDPIPLENGGPGIGVWGESGGYGTGVYGTALGIGTGVAGTTPNGGTGVSGTTSGSGTGVYGSNTSNAGGSVAMLGHSDNGSGGLGPGIGVQGETAGGWGVYGTGTTGYGVVAHSGSGTALSAGSATGSAIVASSDGVGYGLYLTAPSGWAIGCVGRIRVLGAAVGTVTLAHGTISKTVSSTACSGSSQVILTATADPQVRIWATAAPGAFTIHASGAPAGDITFSYFLIN